MTDHTKPLARIIARMQAHHDANVTQIYDGFEPARRALRDPKSPGEVRDAAVEVLLYSNDPNDRDMVNQHIRNDGMAPLADLRNGGLFEPPRINIAAYLALCVFLGMAASASVLALLL